ncbi:hypothetical protein Tco_1005062 [Tanacetum coccineum]|uniref:Uncharacterized protein n=1 Tax=Tanacetum coccineum TaxID=301880 RepID=A0ABQ5FEE3_9ASTR
MLIQNQADVGEGSGQPIDPQHTPITDQPSIQESIIAQSSQPQKTHKPRKPKSKVSGNINKTRSKATLNEPLPQGTGSGSGPRRQDTMGDTIAQTGFENVSKTSNDSLLAGVNTP